MTTMTQGCSICAKRGGVNWVDDGVTKQQSANLAYGVASEDNNNSNENEQWAARPRRQLPSGGENWGDDWVDRGCGGGINTTINNL